MLFGRNSYSCVRYANMQTHGVAGLTLDFRVNDNVSAFGEFDCVADQIHDQLPQPRRVSHDGTRDFSGYTPGKFQAFLVCTDSKGLKGVTEQVANFELRLFQFEFAGFDL